MFDAARRDLPVMRAIEATGWLLTVAYLGLLIAFNVSIVAELLRLPAGFDPGWWPLIETDALYGGLGLMVVLLARLAWRRWLARSPAGQVLPS